MRWFVRLLLPLLTVLLLSLQARAVDVVVLPVGGVQPAAVRASVTAAVRAEAGALGVEVLPATATDRVLADAAAFGNSCAVTVSTCALQMGSLAGGRRVVVGAIDGSSLTLRAYDVVSERELGRIVVPFDVEQPTAAARLATIRLLRPDEEVGTLALNADVLGAVVEVNSEQVGTTPLPPLALRPGHYTVIVRPRELELTFQSFEVDIAFGAVSSVEATFRPRVGGRRSGATASPSAAVKPVYVLDVEAPPDLTLPAALLTVGLVDGARAWLAGEAIVGSPADLASIDAEAIERIADCAADAGCIRNRLAGTGEIDLVATSLESVGDTIVVTSTRFRLGGDETVKARAEVPAGGGGVALASRVGTLIADLYPEVRRTIEPADALAARFAPPPVPLWAWAGTIGGFVVGTAVGAGSLVGYTGAPPDDPLRTAWGAGVVVGAVVAAAGLAGTIVEIPFVDWQGLQGDNALLLEERATRLTRAGSSGPRG